MIESICIQAEASFGSTPQILNNLFQNNFIFGVNGTGKTTISRVIADESAFPHCSVTWSGGSKLEALVYNRDFVENNFDQSSELEGIFTLGEADKEIISKISTAKSELDKIEIEFKQLSRTLGEEDTETGKRFELVELEKEFQEKCWVLKKKHDEKFQGAFAGHRDKKLSFMKRILREANSNDATLRPLSELQSEAEIVFGKTPESISLISVLEYKDLLKLETDPILKKRIVGKPDIDIADMIKKLGNSDWVKQGRKYFENNGKVCPFCQQKTKDTFARSLNEYFDETFENDTKAVQEIFTDYKENSDHLIQQISEILLSPSGLLDVNSFQSKKKVFELKTQANLDRIHAKCEEPSKTVELDSLNSVLSDITDLIKSANIAIQKHNDVVDNIEQERRKLTAQIWKYLLESELANDLSSFLKNREGLLKAIESLKFKISKQELLKEEKQELIRTLEMKTSSIQPAINGINKLLKSFGFNNFALKRAEKERYYKIVRPNGADAKETLSEGEKNFITFLYFYYLLKGSNSRSGITTDRVVVFDDPVCSLDSEVLFIVSTLIKGIFEEMKAGSGYIKQIFVLTHNVYFHREVSYNSRRSSGSKMNEETFWIVSKDNDVSVVKSYEMNPIKSSYELLWMDVRDPARSSITIQNTLRRILENYFKILGNIDSDDICSHFDGKEKYICKSLFSWVNAGSHYIYDDLYVSNDKISIEKYLEIFREIFKKSDHFAHYKMMMGDSFLEGEVANS